jgi:hypothetical protein
MGEDDPGTRGLGPKIAVGIEGNITQPPVSGQPEQIVDTDPFIDKVMNKLGAALKDRTPAGEAALDEANSQYLGIYRLRKALPYGVESVGHPQNYDTKLEPATDKLLLHFEALQQSAGGVVSDIDPDKVKSDRDRAANLRERTLEFTQLGTDCDAARTHNEQRNDKVLRNVSDRIEPLKKPLGPLYGKLALLTDYASGAALQGAQTRVQVGRAVAAATNKAGGLYSGSGTGAGSTAGSGATGGSGAPGGSGASSGASGASGSLATSGGASGSAAGPAGVSTASHHAHETTARPPRKPRGRAR